MTLLNDNYILKNLKEQNEWWTSGTINSELAPAFRRKEYERVENVFFNSIRRFPVLSGPRRVGKSTIAFQIIDKLLKDGIKPERILFYTLDEFPNDGISIKDAIRIYQKYIYDQNDFYLFVDEVQKDDLWSSYLKKLYDLNKSVRALITGSASTILENESGAGRFYTIKIPTMSFYEFCVMNNKQVKIPDIDVFKIHTLSLPEQTNIISTIGSLYKEMIKYFKIGGFPEYASSDNYSYVSKLIRDQVITKAIKQDITSAFNIKNVEVISNIFTYFCYNTVSVINIDMLSKELGIDRTTCSNYITALEKANLIYLSEQLEVGGKKPLKPKKRVYITDNGIKCAVTRNNNIETDDTEFGYAVETMCYKHIRDYFDSIDSELYTVGYIRNNKDQEIDIVIEENSFDIQYVEPKNRNNSIIKDTDGIVVLGMPNIPGYVITKNNDDYGLSERKNTTLYRIPIVVFLYLIGKNKK